MDLTINVCRTPIVLENRMSDPQKNDECDCELCRLFRELKGIRSNCSDSEKEALDTILIRMECAETDRDMLNIKLDELEGREYPEDVGNGFQVANRITMSPHEWEWTEEEQADMARAVMWFSDKLRTLIKTVECYTR